MASEEMREITEDRWGDDIWGTSSPSDGHQSPYLYFLFGRKDYWVADRTRDALITARHTWDIAGRSHGVRGRVKMEIDDTGVPHAFCIGRSSW